MLPGTSIRHIRFNDALLIEQILVRIELIMREIEQRSIDVSVAEFNTVMCSIEPYYKVGEIFSCSRAL